MNEYLLAFSISLIGLILLLLNTIFCFFIRKKNKSTSLNLLFTYLVLMLIIETFCHILGYLKPGSNIFISHFYFNTQLIIITLFFLFLFRENQKIYKSILYSTLTILCIILFSYILNYSNFWEFSLIEISLTSFTIVLYIFYYFYYTFKDKNVNFYYFLSGLGVYLLCSSLIFLTGNIELVIIEKPFIDIWVLNSMFYIFFQYFIYKELRFFIEQKAKNQL
jgi:hypothetical protein